MFQSQARIFPPSPFAHNNYFPSIFFKETPNYSSQPQQHNIRRAALRQPGGRVQRGGGGRGGKVRRGWSARHRDGGGKKTFFMRNNRDWPNLNFRTTDLPLQRRRLLQRGRGDRRNLGGYSSGSLSHFYSSVNSNLFGKLIHGKQFVAHQQHEEDEEHVAEEEDRAEDAVGLEKIQFIKSLIIFLGNVRVFRTCSMAWKSKSPRMVLSSVKMASEKELKSFTWIPTHFVKTCFSN